MNSDLEFLASQPDPNHRRTGRIARLPKATRDQLNQMILDGVPYAEIIQKLGEEGKDLVEKNLTTWRAGGYQDWLRQQQRIELIQSKHEMAMDLLGQNPGTSLHEASRQIAAAQLCELIVDFDPAILLDALREKPEFYARLLSVLARLSESDLACAHHRAQEALLKARLAKEQSDRSPEVMTPFTLSMAQHALNLR
jgi:hypothetical protein